MAALNPTDPASGHTYAFTAWIPTDEGSLDYSGELSLGTDSGYSSLTVQDVFDLLSSTVTELRSRCGGTGSVDIAVNEPTHNTGVVTVP